MINGYVENPGSLAFLNSSEYTYEDDSRQLYAIANSLTSKSGDSWNVSFRSEGRYDEYRVMFYLPVNAKLKGINCSSGLDYLVYASNKSVIAEVQGHDITNPAVNIDYVLLLAEVPEVEADIATGAVVGNPYATMAMFILLLACSGLLIFLQRSWFESVKPEECIEPYKYAVAPTAPTPSGPGQLDLPVPVEQHIDSNPPAIPLNEDTKGSPGLSENSGASVLDKKGRGGIELTREISAVMDTLTDKEQSILKGLLQRGGTMTQTEIRYEMDISKSSLSGILTSMEKRKLITKKEKGRTNVIELSERFLNHKERS